MRGGFTPESTIALFKCVPVPIARTKKVLFTTWINGMAYHLCPLEVALLEETGDPLPWSESRNVLGLPQGIIDEVLQRANTQADDCIQFLRSQGY